MAKLCPRGRDADDAPPWFAVRNPEVFVRGHVRHADHATIVLHGWHRVHLNSEFTTGNVTFYD